MLKKEQPTLFKHFIRACLLCNITFFCLLTVFSLVPLTSLQTQVVTITRQGARSQRIAKDVLEMRYLAKNKVEAVGELQAMLPTWDQDQATLTRTLSPEALTIFVNVNQDFIILDSAAKKTLVNPEMATDPIQVQLILDHEWTYYHAIQQVIGLLTNQLASLRAQVVDIGIAIYVLLIGLNGATFFGLERMGKRPVTLRQLTKPLPEAVRHPREETQ